MHKMGGGDLNLKKSWHPSTLKNQERVWKAEQEKEKEDRKIAELQRELKEERMREHLEQTGIQSGKIKKNENSELNWMYKGPGSHVSREEYLLGRKIDKAFDMLEQEEEMEETQKQEQPNKPAYTVEHDINPESVIQKDENNVQVDMKRKLMEDPLLMIRQNEEATKRAITSNPVKMKQLQLLISSLKEKKKKKKNKEETKSKKKKVKEKKKKKEKSKKKNKKKESSDEGGSSAEEETSDEERAKRRKKVKKLIDKEMKRAAERRKRSGSLDGAERGGRSKGNRMEEWRERRRSRSKERRKRRLDESKVEEDMERRREEMKRYATQRDKQRKENVDKYKEEMRREEEEREVHSRNFVEKLGSASVGSSVESRIRSKVGSLQKGGGHMNSNFLRK